MLYSQCRAAYDCAMSILKYRLETVVCSLLPRGVCPDIAMHLDPFTGGVPVAALVPHVWSGNMPGSPEDNIRYAASVSHLVEVFSDIWIRVRSTPPPVHPSAVKKSVVIVKQKN